MKFKSQDTESISQWEEDAPVTNQRRVRKMRISARLPRKRKYFINERTRSVEFHSLPALQSNSDPAFLQINDRILQIVAHQRPENTNKLHGQFNYYEKEQK